MAVSGSNDAPGQLMPPTVLPTLIAPSRVCARDDTGGMNGVGSQRNFFRFSSAVARSCRREVDHVVDGDMRPRVGWRLASESAASPTSSRPAHRSAAPRVSGIGQIGSPGDPIEDVEEALFGRLRDQLARPPVDGRVDQQRRRRDVVIPDRMVNELEVPLAHAGLQVDGDEASRRTGCCPAGCRRSRRSSATRPAGTRDPLRDRR